MTNAYNSVFLTLSIAELSAAAILFAIFVLLAPVAITRFFRYWLAGWAVFLSSEVSIIVSLQPDLAGWRYAAYPLSLVMCACFLAAAIDCAGFGKSLKYFYSWGAIVLSIFVGVELTKWGFVLRWP